MQWPSPSLLLSIPTQNTSSLTAAYHPPHVLPPLCTTRLSYEPVTHEPERCWELGYTPKWWSEKLEPDGYIHENVCRHLAEAGHSRELVRLLFRPEWAERQVYVNNIYTLGKDFEKGVESLGDALREESKEERRESGKGLRLISDCVILSSGYVERNEVELLFQLHGRLLIYVEKYRGIKKYLKWIEDEGKKPKVLCCNPILVQAGGPNIKIIPLDAAVKCMVVLKDGERVACGCDDGSIAIVNLERSKVEKSWDAHKRSLIAIASSRDGTRIVSGSWDKTVKVWDVESGECFTTFNGHTEEVNSLAIMKDERSVASCDEYGMVYIWDMYTGPVEVPAFKADEVSVICIAVLKDGEHIVTGGEEKLKIWKWRSGVQVGDAFHGHQYSVSCVAVTPDGQHIVSGSWDGTLRLWNIESRDEIGAPLQGHTDLIDCVGVSRDGRRIVSGSDDETIRVWDSESGKQVCEALDSHKSSVRGVSFLGDNDLIISCSLDGTVRVWDIRRKKIEVMSDRHDDAVRIVRFIGNGECVVSGSDDRTLRIWDAKSGRQVGDPIQGHSKSVTDVAVTADGRLAVSVSLDTKLLVWDVKTRKLLHTLTGHTGLINCVALTRQGDRAVTGSVDGTVCVWDLVAMDGSPIVLRGHNSVVWKVFVTDDSLRIVSIDWNDNILVWEIETKTIIREVNVEGVWTLSRREILNLVQGINADNDENAGISILRRSREIVYREWRDKKVLGTVECDVWSWALSPDKGTICLGLDDGQVALMKVEI